MFKTVFTATFIIAASLAPGLAVAKAPDIASQVRGLVATSLDVLPTNHTTRPETEFCPALVSDPETPAGRQIAQANWGVTAEIETGGLTFVSFIGTLTNGTSGSCQLTDGNIGVFEADRLVGLIYSAQTDEPGIGAIMALEGGGIRIWDGGYLSAPLADMRVLDEDLVLVQPLNRRDPACSGTLSVPTLFGLPIHLARRILISEGWTPQPAQDVAFSSYVTDLRKTLPELQDCSGTGFGFCSYDYAREGAALYVSTAGEGEEGSTPKIVGTSVTCEK